MLEAVKSRVDKKFLRAPVLAAISQLVGVVQLVALLGRYGASNATDVYFYLFNLGFLPTQILIVGVLYPMLLNKSRIHRRSALTYGYAAPLLSIAAVGAGSIWLSSVGRVDSQIVPILILSATNAAFQSYAWFRAVAAEAQGVPEWTAAIALPANLVATLAILVPWGSSAATVTVMISALAVGNAGLCAAEIYFRVGTAALRDLPMSGPRFMVNRWFLSSSAVGYGGLTFLQSISLTLPPAILTLANVPMKIVAASSTTVVNALLPRLVHQGTETTDGAKKLMYAVSALLAPVGTVASILAWEFFPQYLIQVTIVSLWLVASAVGSISQRVAYRFLAPRDLRLTLAVVPTVALLFWASSLAPGFGLATILCAYACIDAFNGMILLTILRFRLLLMIMLTVSLSVATIWAVNLW